MQQRRRPSGTDGFDFSYRMVVDSRYTKVAKRKSLLKVLLVAQAALQVIGSLLVVLASKEKGFDKLEVVSVSFGFVSLFVGEVGRRRSHANLLRLYLSLSAISIAFSSAHIFMSDLFIKVIQNGEENAVYDLVRAGYVSFGVLLQIFGIITTVLLTQNMSPKRSS